MKAKIIAGILTAVIATSVSAGIKEKKMMRSVDENITAEIAKTKAACGNAELNVNVSWDKFTAMITANAEKIKKNRDKPVWVLSQAGKRTVSTLEALAQICNKDADYKEEMAKITTIIVEPKEDFLDYYSAYSLNADSTELTALSGHRMTRSASDFKKRLKELY